MIKKLTVASLIAGMVASIGIAQARPHGHEKFDRFPHDDPPAAKEEHPKERHGSMWVAGRYNWVRGAWTWMPGHYEKLHKGHEYEAGRWEHKGDHMEWTNGRWK